MRAPRFAFVGIFPCFALAASSACIGDDPVATSPSAAPDGAVSSAASDSGEADGQADGDAASPFDAEVRDGGEASIQCGAAKCGSGSVCCITHDGSSATGAACMARAQCGGTIYECDSVHECGPGNVCCASTNGGSALWASASCATSCTGSQRQLCEGAAECRNDGGGCVAAPAFVTPKGLRACE